MSVARLLTDEQIRQAHREYQSGKTGRQVAAEFYVSTPTIYKYFRALKLPVRKSVAVQNERSARAWEHTDEILKLRKSGKLIKEIAGQFQVSETTIQKILKKADVGA
ncbi:MAG: hypothetical protein ACI4W6_04175 [Acutalibacteraceae bacterium]